MYPHDPEARSTKTKDGRTHLAHKLEQAVGERASALEGIGAAERAGEPMIAEPSESGAQVPDRAAEAVYAPLPAPTRWWKRCVQLNGSPFL